MTIGFSVRHRIMRGAVLMLCLTLSFLSVGASVDEINAVVMHCKSGGNVTFMLDERPVVTFSGGDVVISAHGSVLRYAASDVTGFTYENIIDGVSDAKRLGLLFCIDGSSLKAANLTPQTKVSVYAADGSEVYAAEVDNGGCVAIPLGDKPSVYIVRASGVAFKVFKP